MKSIKEKAHEIGWVYSKHYDPIACKQEWCEMAAREGANYVLEQIENFMKGLDLGNSAEEKFYKLDVLADIGLFIEQLKK